MHPEIDRILKAVAEIKKQPVMITNGILLGNKNNLNMIIENKVRLQISMDGIAGDRYVRGDRHFDMVNQLIPLVCQSVSEPVFLKMVISKENIDDIEEFFIYAINNGMIPIYAYVSKNGNAEKIWDKIQLSISEKIIIRNRLQRLVRENKEKLREINASIDVSAIIPQISYRCPITEEQELGNILIKSNGNVQPCHLLYADEFCLGNVFSASYEDVIDTKKNEKYKMLRTKFREREKKLSQNECVGCILTDKCAGGCPAIAYEDNNRYDGQDDACSQRRSEYYKNMMTGGKRDA